MAVDGRSFISCVKSRKLSRLSSLALITLSGVAAAAGTAGGPELPGLAAPVVHVLGCCET